MQLPHFQRLKGRSLSFGQASVGHLFATPSVSNLVLTTGLSPRHLPFNDVVISDKKGSFHFIHDLSSARLSTLLSPLAPSLLRQIPGNPTSKLVVAPKTAEAFSLAGPGVHSRILTGLPSPNQSKETWVTDEVLSFFKSEPDWRVVVAMFSNTLTNLFKVDEQLGRILTYLEEQNLLSDTVIVLTSHPSDSLKENNRAVFIAGKTEVGNLSGDFTNILKKGNIETGVKDSALRFHLKDKSEASILKLSSYLKTIPHISEVHYKKKISGRYHYIKTYRSSALEGSHLEWARNQGPILLQSLAAESSPEVVAFLNPDPQTVPLLIWSPNLRVDSPVIKNQLEQTRVRFVDIHPMVLEIMGLPVEPGLDGSPLGISSLIY